MPSIGYSAQPVEYGRGVDALFADQRGSEMRVLVLGGDGFRGWPTSLYLSERGYDVTILDNLSRRKIDIDLGLATEYDRLTSVLREGLPRSPRAT
jgi:hypothetical protein